MTKGNKKFQLASSTFSGMSFPTTPFIIMNGCIKGLINR